tara:strand:- start:65770 stop:66504 length:735 start_codon:yes stop_codon:yes gene_type:complete
MPPLPKIEVSTGLLRTLHRIHRQLADLQSQIDRGPRQIKAGEGMVAKASADAEEAKNALKKMRLASDEKQLQLKTRESRIEDLKAKLNTAASNKEFSLLKEQIAADVQANAVLSDEILEQFEQIDVLQGHVDKAEAELKEQQEEQAKRIAEVESRLGVLKEDLEGVRGQLKATEGKIPGSLRVEYERLIASRGEEALAPVDQESCGGCYQTLTTQVMNQLQLSQLVMCPNCNSLLYLPEDTRVQ